MTAAVTARMLQAYNYFVQFGLTEAGAAAIVGNGCQESGPNLDSTFERVNSNEGSGGFLEWRDSPGAPRKTRLAGFADARGPGLRNDLDTQCDYAMWELQKYFPSLDQQLRNPGRTIRNLTGNFCWVFENPAPASANMDNRIVHAEAVAARAAAIKASQVPQPAPSVPVPQVPVPARLPPVSSTSAGRIAALTDTLIAMRADRVAELVSADPEIAGYDASLAALGKLEAVIIPAVLLKPPPSPPTTKETGMLPIIKAILRNWVTSALGATAGAPALLDIINSLGTAAGPNWKADIGPIITMLLGLAAKDSWMTGGPIPATPEAKKHVGA